MPGPLQGVRVIEFGGIGPGPFAAMMLADHGAEVIRVTRPDQVDDLSDFMLRSRQIVKLDLKQPSDVASAKELIRGADAVIEGFRPGTLERLGLNPDTLLQDNPSLVIGRMTGWGQHGPYADLAGHDINYIAISGALHVIGQAHQPVAPPALVGDFGGGGMMLAFAVTAALLHSRSTGIGQVIDCAMCDGSAVLMTAIYSLRAQGAWHDQRAANLIDGGAHFYGVYETSDGKHVSLGAIEPQFYKLLLERLGLGADPTFASQLDQRQWPELRRRMERIFKTKTRDEWCAVMEQSDVCFAPVLGLAEAPRHAHMIARESFVNVEGAQQPAPTPRYSVTQLALPRRPELMSIDELAAPRASVAA